MTSDLLVDAIRNKVSSAQIVTLRLVPANMILQRIRHGPLTQGQSQDQQIRNSEILVHQKGLLGKKAQHYLPRFVATYRLGMALQIFPANLSLIHTLSAVISRLEFLQKP
jgi:hypothetical protein